MFCCQAEDGMRILVRSRGLGEVYKQQRFSQVGLPSEGEHVSARPEAHARHVFGPLARSDEGK